MLLAFQVGKLVQMLVGVLLELEDTLELLETLELFPPLNTTSEQA